MGPFSFTNSAFLWAGGLVAAPIIIHLLSKRKFVVVDWAAMDFLLTAQKQNRRRVRMEHLILLLLRCLIILLLALLFSRPVFTPSGLGGRALGSHEHVILVDDSPSMGAMHNNQSTLAEAKESLVSFLRELSLDHAGDSVTILLSSRPDRPLVAGKQVSADSLEDLVGTVESVEPSAFPARFDAALLALEKMADENGATANRTCYVVSDFRKSDWLVKDDDRGPTSILKRMLDRGTSVSIIGFGKHRDENVAVASIVAPQSMIVAGVPTRFEVVVINHGRADVDNLKVTFSAGGSLPMHKTVPSLSPGEKKSVPFTFTFADPGSITIQASIDKDSLMADDVRYLCTRVVAGLNVLVVDGEASGTASKSESFYIDRALAPRGDVPSGYVVETVTERQLDAVKFDRYQLVALCNVPELSEDAAKRLTAWVNDGGGLVWFLGDQVDADSYNALVAAHPELMPVTVAEPTGDMTEKTWAGFGKLDETHPMLRLFEGGAFLRQAKFFQWWKTTPADADGVKILARFNDTDETPAIVEQSVNDGTVMVFCTAADAEWGTWVADPSYLVTMQEMAGYMAKQVVSVKDLAVGEPLKHRIDPTAYGPRAKVYRPGTGHFDTIQAAPLPDSTLMELVYEQTNAIGPYRITLNTLEGDEDDVRVAVNLNSKEGETEVLDDWKPHLGKATDKLVTARALVATKDAGGRIQLWRPLILALFLVLLVEQALARHFGAKRQPAQQT